VTAPQSSGWTDVLRGVVDQSHLITGDQLSPMVDSLVRGIALTADVYLVDLGQRVLTPVRPDRVDPVEVETGDAGQAYQLGEIAAGVGEHGDRLLWVPMLDGSERAGVLRIGLGEGVKDDEMLRRNVWSLSGLTGHIIMAKTPYSERLRRMRNAGGLSVGPPPPRPARRPQRVIDRRT
jgi:hypothetical protein